MNKKLTNYDFCEAAKQLKTEVAAIKAVAQVESAGDGFLPDGRAIILFERHHFSKFTRGKYDQSHPQISSKKAGGYYGKEKEYQRFNLAFSLDPTAARKSTSWGKFQIMGFNHELVGFASVGEFVDAMKVSEGEQLKAFCQFVKRNKLDVVLRKLDWTSFARGYNGKNYAINKYNIKMAAAYKKFAKENIDCSSVTKSEELVEVLPKEEILEEKQDSTIEPVNGESTIVATPTVEVPKVVANTEEEKPTNGLSATWSAVVTFLTTTGTGLLTWLAGVKVEIVIVIAIVGAAYFLGRFWFANRNQQRQFESNEAEKKRAHDVQMSLINTASDKDKLTVKVVPE